MKVKIQPEDLTEIVRASIRTIRASNGARPKLTKAILGAGIVVDMDTSGNYVLPAEQGACVDLLYRARERRLEMQRETERVEKLEKQLQEHFINTLSADSTGLAGRVARVQIEPKVIPTVEDWDRFYAYVGRTRSWELLQKRLGEGAIKERWEDGKEVPGVGRFRAKKVSCTLIR